MAVTIDTVYQRVQALANKEQRGYITPQEFNLFANQAQMDIFEQYFYDLNALNRLPSNDFTYADQVDIIASPAFSTSTVNCNYIAKPTKIIWGYAVINEQALYNSTTSVDSGLHESEETTMVMKILELAGITIKQPDIVQVAGQEDLQKTQQEKQ